MEREPLTRRGPREPLTSSEPAQPIAQRQHTKPIAARQQPDRWSNHWSNRRSGNRPTFAVGLGTAGGGGPRRNRDRAGAFAGVDR